MMDHTATVAHPGGWTAGPAWQQTWGRSGQRSSTHLHRGLQGLFFLLFHALLQARQVLGSGAVSRRQALSNAHSRRSSHTSPCPDPHQQPVPPIPAGVSAPWMHCPWQVWNSVPARRIPHPPLRPGLCLPRRPARPRAHHPNQQHLSVSPLILLGPGNPLSPKTPGTRRSLQ